MSALSLIEKIVQAATEIGAGTPAFIALFNAVKTTLGTEDLTALKAQLAAADLSADAEYELGQSLKDV